MAKRIKHDERECEECYWYWHSGLTKNCHYKGPRIDNGVCVAFEPKLEDSDKAGNEYAGCCSSYEQYEREWN